MTRDAGEAGWRNFYGRTKGKKLKPSQRRSLERLPEYSPGPVTRGANPGRAPLDVRGLFGGRPLWIEIGFGSGEHLAHQAMSNPGVGIIGAEPFVNGVAACLGKIVAAGLGNARVHAGDARDLMDVLPEGSVEKAFLLYPDPWPKARHHRRRFVTPGHLGPLRRVMAPGGEFRLATDIGDYVRQALSEVSKAGFRWTAERPADWREPWTDWIPTRYELKALREGRTPHYLTFLRS